MRIVLPVPAVTALVRGCLPVLLALVLLSPRATQAEPNTPRSRAVPDVTRIVAGASGDGDAVASGGAASTSAASTSTASRAGAEAASAASAGNAARVLATKHAAELNANGDAREGLRLAAAFAAEVSRRLAVPEDDQRAYGMRLQAALEAQGLGGLAREYVVLVDRAPRVQALFIYFRIGPTAPWTMIGASPVATGLPGSYEHFLTPLGVFEHTPQHMDFRAEGTKNKNGIRGYGVRGSRIFDFGWTDGERGWGKGGISPMRLQMHATDPDKLEPLLGIRHSKGCVRIPASLDTFLDRHGVLDADYEAFADAGHVVRVLSPEREVTPWAGRYLVVVDSGASTRPAWAPEPRAAVRKRAPLSVDTAG